MDIIRLIHAPVPPMLEKALGYPGDARYVAFWWEPAGDELAWDDGRSSTVGANWHAWLTFVEHPAVEPHLEPYQLGSSDEEARHLLLLDRKERLLSIGERREVGRFLAQHAPPAPDVMLEQFQAYMKEGMERMEQAGPPDMAEIERRIEEEARLVSELQSWLDSQ